MPASTYRRYFGQYTLSPVVKGRITDINGNPLDIIGEVTVYLRYGKCIVKENIWVAENLRLFAHILLGYPAMARHGMQLKPSRNIMTIGKGKYYTEVSRYELKRNIAPETNKLNEDEEKRTKGILKNCNRRLKVLHRKSIIEGLLENNQETMITTGREVRLKSGEKAVIECRINPIHEGRNVITIPEAVQLKGISVSSSLHTVNNGKIFLEISNDRGGKVRINEKTPLTIGEIYKTQLITVEEEEHISIKDWLDKYPSATLHTVKSEEYKGRTNQSRREEIEKHLKNVDKEIPQDKKEELTNLLSSYKDVVALEGDRLGKTDIIKHVIDVPKDSKPIYIPAYRVAYSYKDIIDKEVEKMREEDIIEPSRSPWSFPLLVVPKKDKTYRVVVDFRRLNSITKTDPYPMPSMRDLIPTIGKKKFFSTIDLLQGFLQIPLDEESRQLTSFSSSSGRWMYKRMPFGLKSSPVTFVRLMDIVLEGLLDKGVYVYIDDLIIGTETLEEHLHLLDIVLNRLKKAGLKLKLKKCKFLQKKVTYLGHTLSEEGIQVNEEKIVAIKDYPRPKDKKAVKSFLGLASFYRSFVKDFAKIAAPLTSLMKENVEFIWKSKEEEAFCTLKERLANPPVLAFPDFKREFFLVTDASNVGIGGCLMQIHDGKYKPIAYYSRKLRPAELNYHVTDKECLGIIESLKHFRFIIFGNHITVFTDHSAALEMFKNPSASGRRARWFLIAQDYEICLKYLSGKRNVIADALCRHPPELGEGLSSVTTLQSNEVEINEARFLENIMTLEYNEELSEESFKDSQRADKNIELALRIKEGNLVSTLEEERQIKKNLGCEIKKLKSIDGILCREDKEKDNFTGEEETVTRI